MPTEDDKNKTGAQGAQNAAEGQGQSTGETTPADGQNGNSGETGQAEDTLPKTQEELDKLIERRLKKEQKKWEKAQSQPKAAEPKTEGDSNTPAAAPDNSAEIASLKSELQEARAQNTAAKLGFKADAIDDAVYLAMRNAAKNNDGEFDDEDIKTELSAVLKKHPEWKADAGKATGFRVGAPEPKQSANTIKSTAQKRWNRFNH